MKNLMLISFLIIAHSGCGQSGDSDKRMQEYLDDKKKIKIYIRADHKTFTQKQVDSIRYKSNDFVVVKMIKKVSDSIYYSLVYFDKSLMADRYQLDGTYCGNKKRISLREIGNQFPYNEMSSIRLVSFKREHPDDEMKIPQKNGNVDFEKMFELKTLDKALTDKMLDILANYDNQQDMNITFCYDPRNAIVFVDKSGNSIGYIEICFECMRFKIQPETMRIGGFCNEKFDAIQGLFIKAGINHGMKMDEQ